jgi:hypothetical protein
MKINYRIGDWGLGIGDWAQSPIPNPQPPRYFNYIMNYIFYYIISSNTVIKKK